MLTGPVRRLALLLAVLATTLATTVAGSVPGPAYAADAPLIILDVPNLPTGPDPAIPYLDVPGKRIVDGSRNMDVTGLQGTVIQLHKVDGGYVLGRQSFKGSDLVFLSTAGKRTVISREWKFPTCDCSRADVVVDSGGSSVTFNRRTRGFAYTDTLTVSLPALKIIGKRAFSRTPALFEQRKGRVLLGLDTRLLHYAPRTSAISTLSSSRPVTAADLSAGQQVLRLRNSHQKVAPIPPGKRSSWTAATDANISAWSGNGSLIAGTGEIMQQETFSYIIWRASNGEKVLRVDTPGPARITWESPSSVLIESTRGKAPPDEDPQGRWQLVRCSTAGACEKVGPETHDPYAGFLPATQRGN